MKFKEFFYSEDLEGLFGKVKTLNPGTIAHRIELNSIKPDVKKRGSTVKRIKASEKIVTTSPRPAGVTPVKKPMTLPSNFTDRSRQFTEKPKIKSVKAPIHRPIMGH